MYYRHDNKNPLNFFIIGIVVIIILLFLDNIISSEQYNNGICSCGGTFQYEQAVGHRYETRYLYICNKYGRTIETTQYYLPR